MTQDLGSSCQYIIVFNAHQHKAYCRREYWSEANSNGRSSASKIDNGVLGGDRISRLKSHGQTLEQECRFAGVLCDGGGTSVDLLCQLYGHVMPRTRCLNSKRVEDVGAG